jgi:hypothetical protein
MVAASAPAPTGGAVLSGTYHLVGVTLYTGPGGATGALPSMKQTISIQSNVADVVTESEDGKTVRGTSSFFQTGSSVTMATTCPDGGAPTTGTVSATLDASLVVYLLTSTGQTAAYSYVR